jgi:hypothetical protein
MSMAFLGFWSRISLRRRWRAVVGLALLLGLVGGLSLFAVAGARRTQSAYPRFLASRHPSDLVVDVGGLVGSDGYQALAAIAALPEVAEARAYAAFYTARWSEHGPVLAEEFETLGSLDGRFFVQDVFTPTQGRRPDPNRSDEVAVNEEAARRYGYHVGQQLDLGTVSRADIEDADPDADPTQLQPRLLIHSTIVGVGAFVEEVFQDDTDRSALMLLTPAFVKEAKGLELYAWQGLVLKHGEVDIPAVQKVIASQSGGAIMFRQTSVDVFHAEKATRPVSLALGTFGLLTGLAALVLVGQAIGRYLVSERDHSAVARAMGVGPGAVALAGAANPVLAVVGGVLLAAILSVAASPLMPLGRAGRFEVNPGIDVDWTVLAVGGLVLVFGLVGLTFVVAIREAPHRLRSVVSSRRPLFAGVATHLTDLSPSMATGVRFSVDRGDSVHAVPVRSVMAGAIVAVSALVAAVTFGASMDHLVASPKLFGWNWDVAIVDGAGYGNTNPVTTKDVLGGDPDVEGWSGAFYGSDQVGGENLPLLGMKPGSATTPPIRSGRMVERRGEIVLGTETIRHLGKQVGDEVDLSSGPFRIVGTATFPSMGVVHGNHTSLGVGGIVAPEDVPGWNRNAGVEDDSAAVPPEYGPNVLFVRFRPGIDPAAASKRLSAVSNDLGDYNGAAVTPPQRSAEIVNTREVTGSSTALGGAVAVAALASLTVALTAVVLRRRRDLAVLKSLGFTRRQISAAVAWQATTTVLVGVVVGVPLGIALGRVLWGRFAESLQVLSEPETPLLVIVAIGVAALVAANLIAVLPRRMARSVPSELALRVE